MNFASPVQGFRDVLVKLGGSYKNVLVLNSDSSKLCGTDGFRKQFSERHFHYGHAYENMIGVAAGLSVRGKIPFVADFSQTITERVFEYVRTLLHFSHLNVKIIGTFSDPCLDFALMRALPHMKIFCPCDYWDCVRMFESVVDDYGPSYIRLMDQSLPFLFSETYSFSRASIVRDGSDMVIFSIGSGVSLSLDIAEQLQSDGISARVVRISSLRPLDESLIFESVDRARVIVTVEPPPVYGGLGTAISEFVSLQSSKRVFSFSTLDALNISTHIKVALAGLFR